MAIVIPVRVPESGIASVFKPVFPLFADDALESLKKSGMFALSEPGTLEETLAAAGLIAHEDEELEFPIVLEDVTAAERAFLAAGPTQLAIGNSSEAAVTEAIHGALEPFTAGDGRVVLPAWYRVLICSST